MAKDSLEVSLPAFKSVYLIRQGNSTQGWARDSQRRQRYCHNLSPDLNMVLNLSVAVHGGKDTQRNPWEVPLRNLGVSVNISLKAGRSRPQGSL